MYLIKKHFLISSEAEFSIELDPRNVTCEYLKDLNELGYTRVSFGVQDINVDVQQSINRVQSTAHIAKLVFDAKKHRLYLGQFGLNLRFAQTNYGEVSHHGSGGKSHVTRPSVTF